MAKEHWTWSQQAWGLSLAQFALSKSLNLLEPSFFCRASGLRTHTVDRPAASSVPCCVTLDKFLTSLSFGFLIS